MKILYYTHTGYAWNVQGTTKSLAEEMMARGHSVTIIDKKQIGNITKHIQKHQPQTVWLASSGLRIPQQTKQNISIPIVGFGFSDPYVFSAKRLESYDLYVTNHEETLQKHRDKPFPCHYFPTACDLKFHKNLNLPKTIAISIIGTTNHPRFTDKQMRPKTVKKLRSDKFTVNAFGDGWTESHPNNHKAITGNEFLNVINQSKVGLDLQDTFSPLAHRMLEYGACGTPCITRDRPEVYNIFDPGEILVYDDYDDLKTQLRHYLKHPKELKAIGSRAEAKCRKYHSMINRVDDLMKFLESHLNLR